MRATTIRKIFQEFLALNPAMPWLDKAQFENAISILNAGDVDKKYGRRVVNGVNHVMKANSKDCLYRRARRLDEAVEAATDLILDWALA